MSFSFGDGVVATGSAVVVVKMRTSSRLLFKIVETIFKRQTQRWPEIASETKTEYLRGLYAAFGSAATAAAAAGAFVIAGWYGAE